MLATSGSSFGAQIASPHLGYAVTVVIVGLLPVDEGRAGPEVGT